MTDINGLTSSSGTTAPTANSPIQAGVQSARTRNESLANARQAANANRVEDARAAEARRTEQFRESNEIVQRAIGANTRLEISSSEQGNQFIYRAVDIDTGEVVSEWPPAQFTAQLASVLENSRDISVNNNTRSTPEVTGIVIDESV